MPIATVLSLIGDTPLVEMPRLSPRPGVRIFAKLEGQNPSGSVKDRVALALVEAAERRGDLKPGATIVEASSGNTAIAVAMVAKQKGYGVRVVIPEGVAPSIKDILELYGVDITWCEPRAGMKGAIETAQQLADAHGYYPLRQFFDEANTEVHYRTTGREIVEALDRVDVFVAGIGTGGTLMGVGRRLRERDPTVRVIGVEPRLGERLQGLRSLAEGFIPPLLDMKALDGRFLMDSATAVAAAHRVVEAEGVLAGVSSGACLAVALRVAEKMKRGNIVAMFSDGGWKYLPARPWDAALKGAAALDETHWW
ncbi:MAG: cysteine synthase family protein [Chloroflexi bacterium]|nr:cysteine synthase family protein [Chloroflexota bacterium]